MFPATKHLRSIYRDVCLAMAQEIRCKNNDFCDRMTKELTEFSNKTIKTMKKIIYILLMAVVTTCFFISCNKENNLDISKKNESHAKCAMSNPYDIYGELHNLAMEEARKKKLF
ncbi:MAG: hypothetical protein CW341_07955 [Bacteroidetes bacterium]|nr:hypothetical protein [Bacteroidota bacterium]